MTYFNEIDAFAAEWCGNVHGGYIDHRSIYDVRAADLAGFRRCHFFAGVGCWEYALQLAGWPEDREVWTGSCPCQPFSVAGKREGTADERHLWPEWLRIIKECRPAVIFGEQVASAEVVGTQLEASFVVAVQRGEFARANKLAKRLVARADFGATARWIDGVRTDMEGEGYSVRCKVLGAHSVGAPHIRQRLFWVASLPDAGSSFAPRKRHGKNTAADTVGPSDESRRRCGVVGIPNASLIGDGPQQVGGVPCYGPRGRREVAGGSGVDGVRDSEHSGCETRERASERAVVQPGHWGDWEPLHFIDGKTRRIVTRLVMLADGDSTGMDATCTKLEKEEAIDGFGKGLQGVRENSGTQEDQRETGGSRRIQAPEVLRSEVHGKMDGGADQCSDANNQPSSIQEDGETGVREVRTKAIGNDAVRPPHRRESAEQRRLEFEDVVRLMPSAYPLAIAEGDSVTAEALCLLFPASVSRKSVQHASFPDAKTWRSPSRREIQRAWDSGCFESARVVICSPLTVSFPSRAQILRCIGNAIVPAVAAEFIKAFLECER